MTPCKRACGRLRLGTSKVGSAAFATQTPMQGRTNEITIARISSLQDGKIWYLAGIALVAQLVEHLICNQGVAGSNPAGGTILLQ